jgi:hypothetical protein
MAEIFRPSAFGRQATAWGRALPFSESLSALDELPEPFGAALKAELSSEVPDVQLLIHSPAFGTAGYSSAENVFAITNRRWVLASLTQAGVVCIAAPFVRAAVIELTMILLGGQLRIQSVEGAPGCAIGFNMVSIDLFREAVFMIVAGAPRKSRALNASGTDATSLSFKFRTALAEQTPPGEVIHAVRSWERELPPLAWLPFSPPAAPSGVAAVTDSCLCFITDPQAGKGKQRKGEAPHGKIVTYLPRHHALTLRHGRHSRGEQALNLGFGSQHETAHHAVRIPVRQAKPVIELLSAVARIVS